MKLIFTLFALLLMACSNDPPPSRSTKLDQFSDDVFSSSLNVESKATFVGRWFLDKHSEGEFKESVGISTIRQGSSFISNVSGATKLTAKIAVPTKQNYAPILAVYVNDSNFPTYVRAGVDGENGGGNGGQLILVDLAVGLSHDSNYKITIFIAGLDIDSTKWITGAGLTIVDLAVDTGSITNVLDTRPKALFIGDSITEGLACIESNNSSLPANNCGDRSYSILTARSLGLAPIVNGFGGTGLIKANESLPPTLTNYANFMEGRPIKLENEKLSYAFINIGTNDSGPGYLENMTSLLKKILSYNPKRIFILRPFSSDNEGFANHVPEIQTVISVVDDPRVIYVDTKGWTTSSDFHGAHPNLPGSAKIAMRLSDFITLGGFMEDRFDLKIFSYFFTKWACLLKWTQSQAPF